MSTLNTQLEMIRTLRQELQKDIDDCNNRALPNKLAFKRMMDSISILAEIAEDGLAALVRIRALHYSEDNDRDAEWCDYDKQTWPCETIAALIDRPKGRL